ncbi:mucin-5AC [Penaeus vannamei]|uniref:mucin-5AC n=1 Tax=Penaeus vannamei TaxID=6689 RepID=UPI00387F5758
MAGVKCLLVLAALALASVSARPSTECSCDGCLYPSMSDCSAYWECQGGRAVEHRCDVGYRFNPDTSRCEHAIRVECSTSVSLMGRKPWWKDSNEENGSSEGNGSGENGSSEGNGSGENGSSEGNGSGENGSSEGNGSGENGSSEGNGSGENGSSEGNGSGENGSSEGNGSGENGSSEETEAPPPPTAAPTTRPPPPPTAAPTTRPPPPPTAAPTTRPPPPPTAAPTTRPPPPPTAAPTTRPPPPPTAAPTTRPPPPPTAAPTTRPPPPPTAAPTTRPLPPPTAAPTTRPPPPPTAAPTTRPPPPPTAAPTTRPPPPPTAAPTTRPPPPPTAAPTTRPPPPPTAAPTTRPPPPPTAAPTTRPPPPPTAAPTEEPTKPGNCDVDCSQGQYHPHPSDCHMFIQCTPYGPQEVPCAPGTVWDQDLLTCNHEATTPCVIAEPCVYKQCRRGDGRYAVEGKKTEYYLCHSGVSFLLRCPDEGTFNPHTTSCVYEDRTAIGKTLHDLIKNNSEFVSADKLCRLFQRMRQTRHLSRDKNRAGAVNRGHSQWVTEVCLASDHETVFGNPEMAGVKCLLVLAALALASASARPSTECSCDGCLYPSMSDCSAYWECQGGRAVEHRCGAGYRFNPDTSRCEHAIRVECSTSVRLMGDFASETCVDRRVSCPVYAAAGGCECHGDDCDWPAYVVSSCPKSCDMCGAQSKFKPWWIDSSEDSSEEGGWKPWWKDSSEEGGWKPWWKDSSEENGSSEGNGSGENGSSEETEAPPPPTAAPTTRPPPPPTAAPTTRPPPTPTAAPTTRPPPPPTAAPTTRPPPPPTAAPTTRPPPPPTAAPTTRPPPPPTAAPTTRPPPPPTAAPTTRPPPPPTAAPTTRPPPPPTAAPTEEPSKPGNCGVDCSQGQYHPHPSDCHMFIQCTPYGPQEMPCAPGTVWDQDLLTCNHEATTPCVIADPCVKSHDKQCRRGDGRYAVEGKKTEYYLCHSGVSFLLRCPDEGTFNPHTTSCVYEDRTAIGKVVAYNPEMAGVKCLLVLAALVLASASARPSTECSCDGCLYPSKSDCSAYWECQGGRAVEHRCGAGYRFNPDTSRCEHAIRVECSTSVRLMGDFASETCVDRRVSCPVYAAAGGCECRGDDCDWPAYVVSSCPKSCDMCGAQSKFKPWWIDSSEDSSEEGGWKPWWKDSSEEGGWKPWWKDSSEENGSSEGNGSGENGSSEETEAPPPPTAAPTTRPPPPPTAAPTTRPPPTPTAAPTTRPPPPPTAAPTTRPPPPPTAAPTTRPPPPPTAAPTTRPPPPPTAAPTTRPPPPPTAAPTTRPPLPPTAAPTTRPPPPPTAAPTEEPSKPGNCGVDCSQGQYHPHPSDCHMFIQCTPYGPQEMPCAPGTVWDQDLLTCNHEATTPCVIAEPCVKSHDKQCRRGDGRYAVEGKKTEYYLCHSGVSFLLRCPDEGTFNPHTTSCVYKDRTAIGKVVA